MTAPTLSTLVDAAYVRTAGDLDRVDARVRKALPAALRDELRAHGLAVHEVALCPRPGAALPTDAPELSAELHATHHPTAHRGCSACVGTTR